MVENIIVAPACTITNSKETVRLLSSFFTESDVAWLGVVYVFEWVANQDRNFAVPDI